MNYELFLENKQVIEDIEDLLVDLDFKGYSSNAFFKKYTYIIQIERREPIYLNDLIEPINKCLSYLQTKYNEIECFYQAVNYSIGSLDTLSRKLEDIKQIVNTKQYQLGAEQLSIFIKVE